MRLEHDEDRYDRYDRELAGVFVDDVLIDADIARAGFGIALSVGANTRFYGAVRAGQEEAQAIGRGLYATDIACTVPAQVADLESAVEAAEAAEAGAPAQDAGLESIDAYGSELAEILVGGRALIAAIGGDRHVFPMAAWYGSGGIDCTTKQRIG